MGTDMVFIDHIAIENMFIYSAQQSTQNFINDMILHCNFVAEHTEEASLLEKNMIIDVCSI